MTILIAIWFVASTALVAAALLMALAALLRWKRAAWPIRVGTALLCVLVAGALARESPVAIHLAQDARAAQMEQYVNHPLTEFVARFGPPERVQNQNIMYWRTLPWQSPFRWGSVMLAVDDGGNICMCHVRGSSEALL